MSNDAKVTKDIMETLEDGKKGYAQAADNIGDAGAPDLEATFRRFSDQRAEFSQELERMAAEYGDDIDESGSVVAAAHRAWLSLREALSGSDPTGVLNAVRQGEDHAVEEYDKALEEDISENLRQVLARQATDVRAARDVVQAQIDAR